MRNWSITKWLAALLSEEGAQGVLETEQAEIQAPKPAMKKVVTSTDKPEYARQRRFVYERQRRIRAALDRLQGRR